MDMGECQINLGFWGNTKKKKILGKKPSIGNTAPKCSINRVCTIVFQFQSSINIFFNCY